MKLYQEKWYHRLYQSSTATEVLWVSRQIVADDSGDMDMLTQMLAQKVIEIYGEDDVG